MRALLYPLILILAAAAVWWLVRAEAKPDVVLYCGVDQDQFRPIVDQYERETGLHVQFQGEIESLRSIGLTQKIQAEQAHPRADVFWANEIMAMVDLANRGLIDKLPDGIAEHFPPQWRDPDGRYQAFGGRARVLLVDTVLLPDEKDWPKSVQDLLDPKYGKMGLVTCMARPLTGTTYTHAVALLTTDYDKGMAFLEGVAKAAREGRLKLVASNGQAMSEARDPSNKVAFALVDTDDAYVATSAGDPVKVIYPDQGEGQFGTVLIPNTVGIVKGAPHPEQAKRLIRWLTSARIEESLANGPTAQIPLRTDLEGIHVPPHVKRPGVDFRAARIDWKQVGTNRDRWVGKLAELFHPAS